MSALSSPFGRTKLCLAALSALALLCATAPAALAQAKIKIAYVGDSTADGLWGGMVRLVTRDACLSARIELLRLAKNGTGLTRADKFDWVAETAKIDAKEKPALYVISLGLNDRQSVVANGQATATTSPDYAARYGERVLGVIKNATASGAGVIWVSLAAMREAPANADALAKNKIFAASVDAAKNPAVQFVDRRLFPLVGGETFNSYGPDKNGTMIQLRAPDGEHFTSAGEEIAAAELLPRILANLDDRKVPGASACRK